MPSFLSTHPEQRFRRSWQALQIGLLLLPLSPFLGGLGAIAATVLVWRQQFSSLIRSRLNQLLGVWLILLMVSAATAIDPQAAGLRIFNFLPFILVFAAGSRLIQTPDQLRQISWISAIASIPVVLIGIGQMYSGWHGPIALGLSRQLVVTCGRNPTGSDGVGIRLCQHPGLLQRDRFFAGVGIVDRNPLAVIGIDS